MGKLKLLVLMSVLLISVPIMAQPVKVTPELKEAAIGLFPDTGGPYELRFKSDIRMHRMGFQIINYTLLAGGSEAGVVTRVTSILKEGPAGSIDLLARYDDAGRLVGLRSLTSRDEKAGEAGVEGMFMMLLGKDPRKYKDAVNIVMNGLAAGVSLMDVREPEAPPEGFVLDLRQKILTPGAKLPSIKATDISGKELDTAKLQKSPLIMVFISPTCIRCDDMVSALERGLDLSGKRNTVTVAYIVSSEQTDAEAYAKRLGIGDLTIAEPTDNVSKLFQVPFKPYALMFDKGALRFNVPWEGEEKFMGLLYLLIEGKESM